MRGDLNYCRLCLTLELVRPGVDRALLFGIRYGYADAFRRKAGCRHLPGSEDPGCPACLTFSQALSSDPATVRRHQKPPVPFAFAIPRLPESPAAGSLCELHLTLVGPAVAQAGLHLATLRELLADDPFCGGIVRLVGVETIGLQGERYPLAETLTDLPVLSLAGLAQSTRYDRDRFAISLETPLLLLDEGRPVHDFAIARFLRALMRRVSSLVAHYGGAELELDFRWLSAAAAEVETLAGDFRWESWGRRLAGMVGQGEFAGVAAEFWPLLRFAELVNVGKGASYGMGRFRVG